MNVCVTFLYLVNKLITCYYSILIELQIALHCTNFYCKTSFLSAVHLSISYYFHKTSNYIIVKNSLTMGLCNPCLSPVCPLSVPCLSPVCALSVPCLCPVCPLSVPCLCPVCPLFVPCLSPVCALFVPCLSPVCPLSVPCLYPCDKMHNLSLKRWQT